MDNLKKLFRCDGLNSKLAYISEIADVMSHDIFTTCGYSQFKHQFIAYI